MDIRIETIDNATVVRLSGSLDRPARMSIEAQVVSLVGKSRNLVIELSDVDFISSAGLHFLLELYQACRQAGTRLALTGPIYEVREIMSMVGMLESSLPVYDTLEEGLERFRTRGFHDYDRGEENANEDSSQNSRPSYSIPKMGGDEDVNFSAYYPKEVTVGKWYTLLAYAFIPSALEAVRQDAQQFKDEIGEMRETKSGSPTKLERGTEITIVPACERVTFNPKHISFEWLEDLQRVQFRMQAESSLAGMAGNGTLTVYVGPVIVATLKMGMLFNEAEAVPGPVRSEETVTRIYHQDEIFISYSHLDTEIVLNCQKAYQALGFNVLIDRDTLRSGQRWNDGLLRMIEKADIFQLFWSKNSSKSQFCQQEWQHALSLDRGEGFIRPVYWQEPMPKPPDELIDLHFDYAPFAVGG